MAKHLPLAALLAALCLTGVEALAGGKAYRWQDANGNTVFSDRPPEQGETFETISTRSGMVRPTEDEEPAAAPAGTPAAGTPKSQPQSTGQPPAQEPPEVTYEKNPEYCARAQEQLQFLDTAPRIRTTDDQGELYYMSDEERAEARRKAQNVIEMHCD